MLILIPIQIDLVLAIVLKHNQFDTIWLSINKIVTWDKILHGP